ncbi:MOSC domain-containing protein, partial [Staphylococcus succinus]
ALNNPYLTDERISKLEKFLKRAQTLENK